MKLFAFHTQTAHPIIISSQTVILSQVAVNAFGKSPFTIATRHRRAWLQKQFIKLFRCQRTHLSLAISLSTYLSSPLSHSFACIQSSMPPLFAILTLETTFVICIGVCNFCCCWHFFLLLLLLLFVVQLLSLLLLVLLLFVYICTLLYCIINKQNSSHVQPPLSFRLNANFTSI